MEFSSLIQQSIPFIIGTGFGILLCVVTKFKSDSNSNIVKKEDCEDDGKEVYFCADGSGEYKLVLVVRDDLKMGKGKVAAQCCHAAVMTYEKASKSCPNILKSWKKFGQKKIVVKVNDESELLSLGETAKKNGLIHAFVRDAGRTQVDPGTRTVLAVGPGPEDLIDVVTSSLKLY